MPANKGEILALVYGCIDDINDLRSPDEAIEKRPDVLLVGEGGCLDSLALTTLILDLERAYDAAKADPEFQRELDFLRMKREKAFEDQVASGGADAHFAAAMERGSTVTVCGGGSFALGRARFSIRCARRESVERSSWRWTSIRPR